MREKIYEVLRRPLRRWRRSATLTAYAACFAFPAFGQQTRSELNLVAGNESATIEWSGLEVTSIVEDGAGKVIENPVSPCVITGLTNGRLYRFVLNQPETDASEPIAGSWLLVRDEGWDIYNGERDEWAYDVPPEEAEYSKLTFLPNGKAYSYNVFGLPDPDNATTWSLNDDVLTLDYEDGYPPLSVRVLSLTSSEMVIEFVEETNVSDVDANGDGVINADDLIQVEYYQKTTLRKVSPYISANVIPGEPFVPQNVEVIPDDGNDGSATVSWTDPPIADTYGTASMNYQFTVDGKLSEDFYVYDEPVTQRQGTARPLAPLVAGISGKWQRQAPPVSPFADGISGRRQGQAYNLPTDGRPYRFRLVLIRYLTLGEAGPVVRVVGMSGTETVVKNGEIASTNVYASGGRLYVNASGEGKLTVYTLGGQLYRQQWISAGITSIPVAGGSYIVTFGGRTVKVSVR
jgi:hypothetical protein